MANTKILNDLDKSIQRIRGKRDALMNIYQKESKQYESIDIFYNSLEGLNFNEISLLSDTELNIFKEQIELLSSESNSVIGSRDVSESDLHKLDMYFKMGHDLISRLLLTIDIYQSKIKSNEFEEEVKKRLLENIEKRAKEEAELRRNEEERRKILEENERNKRVEYERLFKEDIELKLKNELEKRFKNELEEYRLKSKIQQDNFEFELKNIEKRYESEKNDLIKEIEINRKEREDLLIQLNENINYSKSAANEINGLKNKLENEWFEFRDNYKDIFTKGEFLRQSEMFKNDSDRYYELSRKWIKYIIISICLVLLTSIWFLFYCFDDVACMLEYQTSLKNQSLFNVLFYQKIVSKIILRLFILGVMLYILKFVLKQYNALMHNVTVAAHKHSSLFGALRIIEVLPPGKTQEEFIAVAGKEIFTQQKTGYLLKEEGFIDISLLRKLSEVISKK